VSNNQKMATSNGTRTVESVITQEFSTKSKDIRDRWIKLLIDDDIETIDDILILSMDVYDKMNFPPLLRSLLDRIRDGSFKVLLL